MTGKEKVLAAFSPDGTSEFGAVIPYEDLLVRDHWDQLTASPWWDRFETDLFRQIAWRRDVIRKIGQDWFSLPWFPSRAEREHLVVRVRDDQPFREDLWTGEKVLLSRPPIGGMPSSGEALSVHPPFLPGSFQEVDDLLPIPESPGEGAPDVSEHSYLAGLLLEEFGGLLCPVCHAGSPLWCCYGLWGFDGLMTLTIDSPEIVKHACERLLIQQTQHVRNAAGLGASCIWIEECMTDMLGPDAFATLALPFLQRLVQEIRECGMHSIYYFCGNPEGKWESLLSSGADALALEEGKKGFTVPIERIAEKVQGRCAVLGNLDAVHLLGSGSEEQLRHEISRQIEAGKRNGGRFVMSLGSPVTPGTPIQRVRLYTDLVHELGRSG